MKAQRRHELRENDLAHAIGVVRAYLSTKGKPIGTAVGIAVIALVIITFAMRSRAVAQENRWRRLSQLTFDPQKPDDAKKSLESLAALTNEASEDTFVLLSLIDQGIHSLRLSETADAPPDLELNQRARQAFEQLLSRFKSNPLALGVAHCGLATVEENLFVFSHDPTHKERARQHLTAVIENPMLNGMAFQRLAVDRRSALDATFSTVVFAPPSPEAAPPSPPGFEALSPEALQNLPPELRDRLMPGEDSTKSPPQSEPAPPEAVEDESADADESEARDETKSPPSNSPNEQQP